MFILARLDVHELLATSKSAYDTNKVNPGEINQKAIFKFNVVNKVLRSKPTNCPDTCHYDEVTAGFNRYFQQRTETFELPEQVQNLPDHSCKYHDYVYETDVIKLIRKSFNAFCEEDSAPTWLIKYCLNVLS